MPVVAASGKQRRQVRFPASRLSVAANPRPGGVRDQPAVVERSLPIKSQRHKNMAISTEHAQIPPLFRELPVIRDLLTTETSRTQDATVEKCFPFLRGVDRSFDGHLNVFGVPPLLRDEHIGYLYDSLEDYPSSFVGIDSSRPWMVYWALAGLTLLGEDVTKYRQRVISTFTPMQNATGGFGGGHGQMSHCASSFAAILSLALVGGDDAFDLVDRKAMWRWLGELKQPDGGFQVVVGGEEDVRGAYCAMVIISLLDLPLELPPDTEARRSGLQTFASGLLEYLSRCEQKSPFPLPPSTRLQAALAGQTFEGGISEKPGAEAHGGYAFCALACLCILGRPEDTISKYMDVPLLLSWLSARQYAPEGGFSGRTNKLVDGCYSHWVGGCWPLIQSAFHGAQSASEVLSQPVTNLYSREGLARYILACCQSPNGGLRDKPGKHVDSYHTCYTLHGLSCLQHQHYHTNDGSSVHGMFTSAFSWKSIRITSSLDADAGANVFDDSDRLVPFHPLYSIPHEAAENMRKWAEKRKIAS